ncbi:hypothetical protein GCM10009734_24290 [Nonomuraea bangladeshensis]
MRKTRHRVPLVARGTTTPGGRLIFRVIAEGTETGQRPNSNLAPRANKLNYRKW